MIIFNFFLVGLGGAIGAMMRHGVGLITLRLFGANFPWGTLTVNIIGSLAIGIIVGLLANITQWSQDIRLFVAVGILGGFTTFSAFSLDSILLFECGQILLAGSYIVASVVISILATFCGLFLMRVISG